MPDLYSPYISDTSEDSESDGYTTEESLSRVSGTHPPLDTNVPLPYPIDGTNTVQTTGTKFESSESVNTSLIQIQSRDRDFTSYPQPTSFSIRLPRVFKNVKTVNISQINLLNSFFSFTKSLGNTTLWVNEFGRTTTNGQGTTTSNPIQVTIRDGSYGASDLAVELNNAMNNTPIFSDLSLADFISKFQSTGNYSLPFNNPNSNAFNALTNSYDSNQTIDSIVSRYFQTVQTFGQTSYSYNESLVVYYYPVVKEFIIRTLTPKFSVIGQMIPPGFSSWYDYIVFAFQGINDPYITPIVADAGNQVIFDAFRNSNTFNSALVNGYNVTYNGLIGRYNFATTGLCYSISNDLNTYYNSNLGNIVTGIQDPAGNINANLTDFQGNLQSNTEQNGALTGFYNYFQTQFASHFGVDFGKYSAGFYGNSNNQFTIYNTANKYGWNSSLTPKVSLNQLSSTQVVTQTSNHWPNIYVSTSQSTFVQTRNIPEFPNNIMGFSNAGENTFGYVDVPLRLLPTTYNRVVFQSPCRQNISVMTIPRYIGNRGPGTEEVYNFGSNVGQTPLLFDTHSSNAYIVCDVSGNIYFNMFTLNQSALSDTFHQTPANLRAGDEWVNSLYPQILAGLRIQDSDPNKLVHPPISVFVLTSYRPYIHFEMVAGSYPNSRAHFSVSLYVETQDGRNFAVPLLLSWYKDRAAFMADVPYDLSGNNTYDNPRHSFQSKVIPNTVNSFVTTVDVNNNQSIYVRVRTQGISNLPSSIPIRVFCVLTNPYGVYTIQTQNDRLHMPFAIVSSITDQYTPADESLKNPLRSIYDPSKFQLGYDISGVSNNLLDYVIQSGNSNFYDPNTITDYQNVSSTGLRYMFDFYTGGSGPPPPTLSSPQTWSLYFGSNTSNVLRDTYNPVNNVYLSSLQKPKPLQSGSSNESLLVNWLNPASILVGNSEPKERFLLPSIPTDSNHVYSISSSSVFLPCTNSPSVRADSMTTPTYTDISGLCGFSMFLPPNKLVSLESFLVKFAYTQPSSDVSGALFTRTYSPLSISHVGTNSTFNHTLYRNQTTYVQTSNCVENDWDDWFLYNRRNIKLGVFPTSDISGANLSTLNISSALCTFTLQKVTQVNNYQDQLGTLKIREPGWGTWYTYKAEKTSNLVWDVEKAQWTGQTGQTYWRSTIVQADKAPTYTEGGVVYPNCFQTPNTIHNYSYIPRSFGIAPAVGNAIYDPSLQSTFQGDIPNSYTCVPYYWDSGTWKVGSLYGLSYTRQPCVPPPSVLGSAPYYGPAGGYGWTNQNGTFQLYNSDSNNSMYYWNTKVTFHEIDTEYNPATDLSLFGGYDGLSGEFQDTMLFLYKNTTKDSDLGDVSTTNTRGTKVWKWGQEQVSSYQAFNDSDGYNLMSYIYDEPVRSNNTYAVHLRAYAPTPEFTTGIRIIGKNSTDFGTLTLAEIANEISSLKGYTPITDVSGYNFVQNLYSPTPKYGVYTSTLSTNNAYRWNPSKNQYISHDYADALIRFNSSFVSTFTFGKTNTFTGNTYTFNGFSSALSTYVSLYTRTQANLNFYLSYLSTATADVNSYLLANYGGVLPSNIVQRNNLTNPLPFQFLFQSKLEDPYTSMLENWGIGYSLGFTKADTAPPKTSITSDNFIRVAQDYIYVKLNPELNMNPIAISGKENLSETHDSMGESGKYFAKILLNTFGNYCSTAIINPKTFNPVLGKFDTVRCQLFDKTGKTIDNSDCEFDFILSVGEVENGPLGESSLIRPPKGT